MRLEGKTIAVTGPRKADEMARMISKFGGTAVIRPAQGTVFLDDSQFAEQLQSLIENPVDWLVLTTGVGTEALLAQAEKLGQLERFIETLRGVHIAARGYKTVNVLRKVGLTPEVRDEDGTTAGLLQLLGAYSLAGKRVGLQLYGDPAPKLNAVLEARGAICEEILPYRHIMPEGGAIALLIGEIVAEEVDAVAFTSTVQVRCLMSEAAAVGMREQVLQAFEGRVLAVAVGKVTAEALREEGVTRVLFPEEERMGSMVVTLSRYYDAAALASRVTDAISRERTVQGRSSEVIANAASKRVIASGKDTASGSAPRGSGGILSSAVALVGLSKLTDTAVFSGLTADQAAAVEAANVSGECSKGTTVQP
ncbi:uroporphyrinogen-III synthase [Paenibacillus cellulosilyticus]|uniref:Uroporphyrinogen-III synthase n=1 Tax=Paenibacillus cellulosilyticus TaxID=375489 RepID=A0A2V2Z0S2_9BACL|nr:uroporphyrinogen-III synthase [Paenibacillus cellulosilyticus]QKS48043.1 uroporphyrinogen-III synthase [Paenibacillus cellulosilyticus]